MPIGGNSCGCPDFDMSKILCYLTGRYTEFLFKHISVYPKMRQPVKSQY